MLDDQMDMNAADERSEMITEMVRRLDRVESLLSLALGMDAAAFDAAPPAPPASSEPRPVEEEPTRRGVVYLDDILAVRC